MEDLVKVGRREAVVVLSRRAPVRLSEIGSVISSTFAAAYGHIGEHGVEPMGPPFVIYDGVPVADDPFDLEICAPIAHAIEPPAGWRVQVLPAGSFATLMHTGPYDTIGRSYEALTAWLGAHSLPVIGPPREVYLSPPGTPADQIRTIIEFPIADAPAPIAAG